MVEFQRWVARLQGLPSEVKGIRLEKARKRNGDSARLATHPPVVFACILAVQKLIRSDDPDAFHFLADSDS